MLFLLRFANSMRTALQANNQERLNASFQNLKAYFRYIGIIIIVMLVFIFLGVIMNVAGMAASS